MSEKEIWKEIAGFNGRYFVSNLGRVKSIIKNKEKILKQGLNKYHYVNLFKNGKYKSYYIHRLLGTYFIKNPENKQQINHKDGNKTNNSLENLEWCTSSENRKHSFDNGLQKSPNFWTGKFGSKNPYSKKVIQIDKYTLEIISVFGSVSEASRALKIPISNISSCCRQERKTAGGYKWKFQE